MRLSPRQKHIAIASTSITLGLGVAGLISGNESVNSPEKVPSNGISITIETIGRCLWPFERMSESEAAKMGKLVCLYSAHPAK